MEDIETATMSTKGQVIIPARLRKKYGLKKIDQNHRPGDSYKPWNENTKIKNIVIYKEYMDEPEIRTTRNKN